MARRRELKRGEAQRQRAEIIRRASLFSVTFLLAGVVVAVLGAALVALLLRTTGLPFLATWLVLSVVVIAGSGLLVWLRSK